ncbi:MAG: glycosyltransferase family 2 protein [Nitrospirae bacterium]|nr:glycosyltransferase family 2 protein [Nitrospirota bacterium]
MKPGTDEGLRETKLSIVIPAYNEALRIGKTLDSIRDYMKVCGYSHEIIVVDDGSSDDTAMVVRKAAEKHPAIVLLQNGMNRGKGYSVKQGVLFSRGRFVLMSDADLSTPIAELGKLFKELEEGNDIAIGSRSVSGSMVLKRQKWFRQLMGKTFNKLVQAIAVFGIRDTQCGFKLFTADAARSVFSLQRIERFAFDVEALYLARKMDFGIREVPVIWVNSPDSRVSIFRDSLQMLRDLFRIRFYHYRPERGKS